MRVAVGCGCLCLLAQAAAIGEKTAEHIGGMWTSADDLGKRSWWKIEDLGEVEKDHDDALLLGEDHKARIRDQVPKSCHANVDSPPAKGQKRLAVVLRGAGFRTGFSKSSDHCGPGTYEVCEARAR